MSNYDNNFEIQILREYLRIPTVHPNVNYGPCVEFLKRQADALELPVTVHYPVKQTKPVVVMTWIGRKPELPAIMFNSHMDVVPVYAQNWTHFPFAADIDVEGRIYARGVQDTKALGMQYLAAIRCLKNQGFQGYRTAYITFVPEEEVGGKDGMKDFVKTKVFRELNIGFAMDEGYATRSDKCHIVYGERTKYQVRFKIHGSNKHVSMLPKKSAGEKFQLLLNKLMTFRKEQRSCTRKKPGFITAINLTKVDTISTQEYHLPTLIEALFDIRLGVNVDPSRFYLQLKKWCYEVGSGIDIELLDQDFKRGSTELGLSNIYWMSLKNLLNKEKVPFKTVIMSGSTDMRFLRDKKIPAIGFSPMTNTPMLAHNADEYLHAETYLKGIEIFTKVFPALLNAGVDGKHFKVDKKPTLRSREKSWKM